MPIISTRLRQEARQCAENQCPQCGVDDIWDFVKSVVLIWVLTGVRINFLK